MTPTEFRTILIDYDLTLRQLALLTGVSGRLTRYWKHRGLDEDAGGAQAAVASMLRLMQKINRDVVKAVIAEHLQEREHHEPDRILGVGQAPGL